MPEKHEPATHIAVHVGETILKGDKPGIALLILPRAAFEEAPPIDHSSGAFYIDRKSAWNILGGVWELERYSAAEGTIRQGAYLGLWPDQLARQRFQIESLATRDALRRRKEKKNDKRDDPLRDACAQLRELYHKTPFAHRQAALAKIIYEVTR